MAGCRHRCVASDLRRAGDDDVEPSVRRVCDEAGIPHPTIISESGRALVAYHSVLVFDVLGTHNFVEYGVVVRNSIEQDADVIMFIYLEE